MSVQTTADDNRDEAKDHIDQAIKCLSRALEIDTWGSDQYNSKYIDTMEKVSIKLRKLNRKL